MSHIPSAYNPIKTLAPVPCLYAARDIPSEIDLNENGNGEPFPLHLQIDMRTNGNLPFILSIKARTSELFYFTINNKQEDTFQYLGRSDERNKEKRVFLDTFLESNKGKLEALSQVADMYAEGRGVQQNSNESIRYYRLAAMQGDLKARVIFARCMSHGLFEGVDPGKGVEMLKLIATTEYPETHYQLAIHLEEGIACEKDHEEALHHCEIAAGKDHKMALLALAVHYAEQKDYERVCDLIDKMIILDFGKDKREIGALRWIDQLSIKLPIHLLEAAEKLREKILTFC